VLKNSFDPRRDYYYFRYGRMSDGSQNPRSPDQQFSTINDVIRRGMYSWRHKGDYRDDGVSGRKILGRPEFQRMLSDIKTKAKSVDLILVDTFERFGRADEVAEIRRDLQVAHGVLVLTADNGFADPTTASGVIVTAIESIRATEDTRIKAHNVLRGKLDAARQKKWPGGSTPFGLKLEPVYLTGGARQEIAYYHPVPDPAEKKVIQLVFQLAVDTGWGQDRIAKHLNANPDIPDCFKPFNPATVGRWLGADSTIYYGAYKFNRHATGIVRDRRVIQRNDDEEILLIEDFCEPLISRELWDEVQRLKATRRRSVKHLPNPDGKQYRAIGGGIAHKYPLNGLVRCGHCGRAMRANGTAPYTDKNGNEKRYVKYACPMATSGVCSNDFRVSEPWLRDVVINAVADQLFRVPIIAPQGGCDYTAITIQELEDYEWYHELRELVLTELERTKRIQPNALEQWERDRDSLHSRMNGWNQSLADETLPTLLRKQIQDSYAAALADCQELEEKIASMASADASIDTLLDPLAILSRLNRLGEVISQCNPTRMNLELSLHLESIRCFSDSRVVMRTCRLGAIGSGSPWPDVVLEGTPSSPPKSIGENPGTPRRRSALATGLESTADNRSLEHFATDPNRFEGLDDRWFDEIEFWVPEPTCWAESNASAVWDAKQRAGASNAELARQFGKSIPTIRKSLRIAKERLDSSEDAA